MRIEEKSDVSLVAMAEGGPDGLDPHARGHAEPHACSLGAILGIVCHGAIKEPP